MSCRLIDHEPEGRTDKVSATRGHSVAEGATSAPGTFETSRMRRAISEFEGKAENICSH